MTQPEQNTWNLDETLGTRWYETGNYAPNTNSGSNTTNVLGSLNNSMASQHTVPASQNNMAPATPAAPASPSPFKPSVNGYTPRYLEEKEEEEEEEEARPIRGRMPYRNYSAGLRNSDRSRSRSRGTWPNDNSRSRSRGGYRRKSKRHTKKNTKRNRKTNRKSHH